VQREAAEKAAAAGQDPVLAVQAVADTSGAEKLVPREKLTPSV